ncbi:hypothetical protein FKP32DRAFT_1607336 [Trametes sanguinea]|nr:hypothetical protein FKP32DRAFT_1607336 [Trametes sanguinea]
MFDNSPRRLSSCVSCDAPQSTVCNCGSNETCIVSNGDCHTCPSVSCVPNSSFAGTAPSATPSKGLSPGLVAALLVPLLIVALATVVGVWLYRRRVRLLREQLGVVRYPTVVGAQPSGRWLPERLPVGSFSPSRANGPSAMREASDAETVHSEHEPVLHAKDASTEKVDW